MHPTVLTAAAIVIFATPAIAQVTVTSSLRNCMASVYSDDPDRTANNDTFQQQPAGIDWTTSQGSVQLLSLSSATQPLATAHAYFNSGVIRNESGEPTFFGVGEFSGSARVTDPMGTSMAGSGLGWSVEFEVETMQRYSLTASVSTFAFSGDSFQLAQCTWSILIFRIVDGDWESTVGGREGSASNGANQVTFSESGVLTPGRYAFAAGEFSDFRTTGPMVFNSGYMQFSFALPGPSSFVLICGLGVPLAMRRRSGLSTVR
ncbi:MAG: hypothetical protein ACREJO_02590 [Phycisphaerales bacterium]